MEIINERVHLVNGRELISGTAAEQEAKLRSLGLAPREDRNGTICYSILNSHNQKPGADKMRIKFDSLISHDITYVGIIQTARYSGLEKFPIPYAMTNCHNSLCAVGGTINEDDHVFGLSAAKKYGGIYVPANQAVIHQYAREMMSKCGNMILGSDSHTRYGALGTMGVGEGGPELVKQLLSNTWDITPPQVVLVYLENAPKRGVGPHDVAIALCGAVFGDGLVTNKVLEFVGPGVKNLSMDFRIGIDVMTTETACLSSIWETDDKVKDFYTVHGRPEDYKELKPERVAAYDMAIKIDLSKIESMIALPFHPSNAYTIHQLQENPEILREVEKSAKAQFGDRVDFRLSDKVKDGKIYVDQGIIAGCAGGMFENICEAAAILDGKSTGDGYFSLSVYPSSVPVNLALIRSGVQGKLLEAGAVFKPCFCGPCFGAGDVPANNGLSIRHTTRNFPNREGSKPGEGQLSGVALVDSRSIAATALNKGVLTAATDIEIPETDMEYTFDSGVYEKRVYQGFGKADSSAELKFGPNITDWPKMYALEDNLLLKLACVIHDDVTTTDELIPSGETSSYRSNPLRLSEFALSRREPQYVPRAKAVAAEEAKRRDGNASQEVLDVLSRLGLGSKEAEHTQFGSCVFACRPGDGSAREQAASCQKVLGGFANICYEFATKRYRSNCINWGILPFTIDKDRAFDYENGDYVFVPGIREAIKNGTEEIPAKVITAEGTEDITLYVKGLTEEEKTIILEGCLMNYYRAQMK
ncbi:MAG: hydratase [Oscillospiraceae bacterium]|nr:hydratase [Oscillospiraceae bacterium]